uniref:C2H2-type domain-containing protein n=2 Tax=Meloidogyne incognita TaxID=6306 RepID=A0A914KWL4_MELIC
MSLSDVTEIVSTNTEEITEIRPTVSQLINAIRPINGEDGDEDMQNILQTDINSSILCTICNKDFKNRGSALFHAKKSHSILISSIDSILGVETEKQSTKFKFFCPLEECIIKQKKFCSAKLLIQHFQKTHFEKNLKCEFCTAKFSLERDLRYHNKKVCPKQKLRINYSINSEIKIGENKITKKDTGSQTEKWLVPTKILIAGKFTKIHPKRKLTTTEKHIYTQTEIHPPQQSELITNYNQNNNLIINTQQQQQYLSNQEEENNNNFNNSFNNNNICYQTVEESTQTFYGSCCCSSSFDLIDGVVDIGGGGSLLRNNGWTQTPPLFSYDPYFSNNLMEMQSTSVQTDTIVPSIWNL